VDYDPFDTAVKRDPYPFYAQLRRTTPIFHVAARRMWAVSRHADVSFALRRPDLFSSSVNADGKDLPAAQTLLGSDPPDHTRLRKRVEQTFTPRRVRELGPRLEALAAALMGAFAGRGVADAIADLAAPLPVILIAELMGIDPGRHGEFKQWADAVIIRGTGRASDTPRAELDARVAAFKAYLGGEIETRRHAPADDLISALVRDEPDAPGLPPAQALNFAVLLLLGGSETTTHLIGNALRALFADPPLLARVRDTPALIRAVVEETLRHDPPVQCVLRRTTADIELAGQRLPAGATVLLLLASANRDERVFTDGDHFLIDRDPAQAKAVAFGAGPHHCLGATLARMEATAALQALLALPGLRPAYTGVELVDSFVLRGPRALPIGFDDAAR
jgi:cytochrome P450